jgi:archaellin
VIPAVKWQAFFAICMLVIVVFAAGCTDEESQVQVPPPSEILQPGQVLVAVGDVTGDGIAGGTIDTLTLTLGLAPGKGPVDMEKFSIYYADTVATESLVPVKSFHGEPGQGEWGIVGVNNQVGNANNRLEDNEQVVIRINPKAYLPANRVVTIAVIPPGGPPLTIRRVAPPVILKENNILAPR